MFRRKEYKDLLKRLKEPAKRIQVILGPRQTGKTTLVRQVFRSFEEAGNQTVYASADMPVPPGNQWIDKHWNAARARSKTGPVFLALDEVQKVRNWSETVKFLWDQEKNRTNPLKVVLLGSSSLLMQSGLTESMAGRYELIRMKHWSYAEMKEAFGLDLDQYLVYGGYPGGADLVGDFKRWRSYILDSLVETSISRDLLMMTRVHKPVLLRKVFMLACEYPCRILSYNKMLGQLQEAGNTTTLAHYLDLLGKAGLVTGLQKFSGSRVRKRGSSPKLLPLNTALITAVNGTDLYYIRSNTSYRGRLVEAALGAHIFQNLDFPEYELSYWKAGSREVDYVLHERRNVLGMEVYSGSGDHTMRGLEEFKKKYSKATTILVGGSGLSLERALEMEPRDLLKEC
ncbi:MAG: AAA family ATPase [Candidatus Aegiribacteria sp.]|nr:AAA family ATPase [Candidatus Aegiribacteria sp.]